MAGYGSFDGRGGGAISLIASSSQANANISGRVSASSGNSSIGIATRVIIVGISWQLQSGPMPLNGN